jgi:hypothetical protein
LADTSENRLRGEAIVRQMHLDILSQFLPRKGVLTAVCQLNPWLLNQGVCFAGFAQIVYPSLDT